MTSSESLFCILMGFLLQLSNSLFLLPYILWSYSDPILLILCLWTFLQALPTFYNGTLGPRQSDSLCTRHILYLVNKLLEPIYVQEVYEEIDIWGWDGEEWGSPWMANNA